MKELVEVHLQKGGYTPLKLANHAGCEDPFELVFKVPHVAEVQARNAQFFLYERALHVFGEAERVHQFR